MKLKEAIGDISRSERVKSALGPYHAKMSAHGFGLVIDGNKVGFSRAVPKKPEDQVDLLFRFLVSDGKLETTGGSIEDMEPMLAVMEAAKELKSAHANILTAVAGTPEFVDLLNSTEVDDKGTLAKLCISVSATVGTIDKSFLATLAESANPDLIIQMTKAVAAARAALTQVVQAAPVPTASPVHPASAPPVSAPARAKAQRLTPVEELKERLVGIGMGAEDAQEMMKHNRYAEKATECLANLNAIIDTYGEGFTLVIVHKNKSVLLGYESRTLDGIHRELKKAQKDRSLKKDYAKLTALLTEKLQLPLDAIYLGLPQIQRYAQEEFAIGHLELLLSKIPAGILRSEFLIGPYKFAITAKVEEMLAKYTTAAATDPKRIDEIVHGIMAISLERSRTDITEQFARNFVSARYGLLSTKDPNQIWTHVEYGARAIKKRATEAGIPGDFCSACMENGMTTFEAIEKAHAGSRPEKGHGKSEDKPDIDKYGETAELLRSRVGLSPKECAPVIAQLTKCMTAPGTCKSTLESLLAAMPAEEVKSIVLRSPSVVAIRTFADKKIAKYQKTGGSTKTPRADPALIEKEKTRLEHAEKKYSEVLDILKTRVGLSEVECSAVLGQVAIRGPAPATSKELLELLLAAIPHDELKVMIIKSPILIGWRASAEARIARYQAHATQIGARRGTAAGEAEIAEAQDGPAETLDSPEVVPEAAPPVESDGPLETGPSEDDTSPVEAEPEPESEEKQPLADGDLAEGSSPRIDLSAPMLDDMPRGEAEKPLQGDLSETVAPDQEMLFEIQNELSGYGVAATIQDRILEKATTVENVKRILRRLEHLKGCTIENAKISPEKREPYYKGFVGDQKNIGLLVDKDSDAFDNALLTYLESIESREAQLEGRRAAKRAGNGNLTEIRIRDTDVDTYPWVCSVPIAPGMKTFIEEREVDPHQFLYLALKVMAVFSNRSLLSSGVKIESFETSIHLFGAEGKPETLLRKITTKANGNTEKLRLKTMAEARREADDAPVKKPFVDVLGLVLDAMDAVQKRKA